MPMISPSAAHAIILTGGKSSRMGTDKASLKINGETLLERQIRLLSPVFGGIIVGASSGTPPSGNAAIQYVPDEKPGYGPLMAIYTCLAASTVSHNFVIACDIPEIDYSLIRRLLDLADRYDIVAPSFTDGLPEPLFAVYNRSCIPVLARQLDEQRLKITDCFLHCNSHVIPTPDTGWYRNLNTPVQFEAYNGSDHLKLA